MGGNEVVTRSSWLSLSPAGSSACGLPKLVMFEMSDLRAGRNRSEKILPRRIQMLPAGMEIKPRVLRGRLIVSGATVGQPFRDDDRLDRECAS